MRKKTAIEAPNVKSKIVKGASPTAPTGLAGFKEILVEGAADIATENKLAMDREIALAWLGTAIGLPNSVMTGHTSGGMNGMWADPKSRPASELMLAHIDAYMEHLNDPREIGVFREV